METKEFWLKTAALYPFRMIAQILSALSMDEHGLSLKKILATFSTFKAAQFTQLHLEPNNVIILVFMWLVYAGILVGIYSITDIANATKTIKGTKKDGSDDTKHPV